MSRKLSSLARSLQKQFRETADELDEHFKNVNIARVSGGVAGVAGAAVAIGSLIAAPFTLGATLPGVAIGTGLAVAGGATSGGASLVGAIIGQTTLKKMAAKWVEFLQLYSKETGQDVTVEEDCVAGEDGKTKLRVVSALAGSAGVKAAQLGARGVAELGGRAGTAGAKVVAVLGTRAVLGSAVTMGLSLYDIIDGSIEIHKEKKSPAGQILREFADALDEVI